MYLRRILADVEGPGFRKKGSEATVDINDRNRGEVATMFMVQVAAVSCAATQVPDSKLANQS